MTDKENIEFSFKTDTYPTILNALKDMLMDGFTIQVQVYDNKVKRVDGKRVENWKPITRLQLRAWKSK